MSNKRVPWNKGKKNTIKYKYYTDGNVSIRIPDTEEPPEGFYPGRIRNYSDEARKQQAEKTKQTKLEKYGSTTYNNSCKAQATKIEKYGASQNFEKIKQANLEKYGVENVFQADVVKEKIKKTVLEKYGVENISMSDSNKEKIQTAWKNKTTEELNYIQDRRAKTNLERYGYENAAVSETIKEKTMQTCMEKYGVPFFCMTDTCRNYSSNNSFPNLCFGELLTNNDIAFEREFVVERKSYDFKISNTNTLIEINPTATHNSTWGIFGKAGLDKDYHFNKSKLARDNGYRCIHIFDWDNTDKILDLLKRREIVYARNCTTTEIDQKEANEFLNKHHLQNACKSEKQIGLFCDSTLVSVMTFGRPRYNKKYQWELLRYASSVNVLGGAEKLFKYFLTVYNPESIISYCDFSKFNGKTYEKLGFIYDGYTIGKHWYNPKTKKHFTDNLLRLRGFDQLLGKEYGCFGKGTQNEELMKQFGFVEVYDAGQGKYTLNLKS